MNPRIALINCTDSLPHFIITRWAWAGSNFTRRVASTTLELGSEELQIILKKGIIRFQIKNLIVDG
jgi:hypothetical protein